jgi:uroporphyrinogen-III decarboxylase
MTSKERVLATIRRQPVDHLPLCFTNICHGILGLVEKRYTDLVDKARFFIDLGVDAGITVAPPFISEKGITLKEWQENVAGEAVPVLHKEYHTRKGVVRQVVRKTFDYPNQINLISDHNVPASRSVTYLVETEQDLDALECLLTPPDTAELVQFRKDAERYKKFCQDNGVFFSGYLAGVGDPFMWFSGVERTLMSSLENPHFMHRYADIVSRWNQQRLEIMLEAGTDLIIRRGWYESTDFWSPTLYRQFLMEPLRQNIAAAHQAGAVFTYVMNSGAMPLLDIFNELDFDIFSNIDPQVTSTDLSVIKRKVGGTITLCGGVNNNLVIEQGSVADVRQAVTTAVEKLSPNGGFILAPGDSILSTSETAVRNFYAMIDVWKELRG